MALLFVSAVVAVEASAKTFRPTKLGDEPISGDCLPSDCTLRDAVNEANTNPGADSIELKPGKTYRLSQVGTGEDTDVFGDLDVLEALHIKSGGRKPATIDAQGIDRVLDTPGLTGRLTLERLVITGGDAAPSAGGGLLARGGTLRVVRSQFRENQAVANYGGGLLVGGGTTATIIKSTFTRNEGEGGGLAVGPGSTATVLASTVSRNRAGNGGGVFVGLGGDASFTATNSTIANNTASGSGGGLAAATNGTVALRSTTVARNVANTGDTAQQGGGVAELSTGPIVLRNSILALNRVAGTTGAGADCGFAGFAANAQSEGRNLVSDDENCGAVAGGPNLVAANPKLGRLGRNGGPTETIGLKRGSKAIDRASRQAPGRDQRGVKRDRKPDIGSFERE